MKDTTRTAILNTIRHGSVSASSLAFTMGIPQPSLRRLIGELRAEGWRIVTNYFGYRLQQPERA